MLPWPQLLCTQLPASTCLSPTSIPPCLPLTIVNPLGCLQEGYGEFQVTHNKGFRADAFQTYLKPALGRGNLKVVTGARTTKIGLEKGSAGPRTRGVEFATGGPQSERFTGEPSVA